MLVLDTLFDHCCRAPEHLALEMLTPAGATQERVPYQLLWRQVERTASYLQRLGLQAGDRVALRLPKGLPFVYLHLATLRLGAIALPLNPAYPADELAYFLTDSEARLFFVAAEDETARQLPLPAPTETVALDAVTPGAFEACLPAWPLPEPLPPRPTDPDQVALMIYTSGTTGRPKGALITQGNLTANLDALHLAWGWQAADRLLHILPLFHVHGLVVALHGALHAGASALLLPHFDPRLTLELLTRRRCTVLMGVPTIHRRLVDCPDAASYDLSHVRLITSGSDRLPDDLFQRFQAVFGHTLLERYGMTETGMNLSNPLHGERRLGSVGLPLPGVEARIADMESNLPLPDGEVGEVQIRGPHVCRGYWRQPDKAMAAFTPDGWLKTGDLGLRQPDGYFVLKGRAKDLIITGGLNVYPPEVERVLAEHPAVSASAVIGCPNAAWGEQVTAVIVPQPGQTLTPEAILDFCRQRLAAYKLPRRVVLLDALPRNALGKVQKAHLRSQVCPNADD